MPRFCARDVFIVTALVASSWPITARGGEPRDQARELYEQANHAYRGGRYAEAARLLLEADRKVPNEITLLSALEAAERSDDPVLALEAADRAAGRSEKVDERVRAMRERFEPRVGRIVVRCPARRPCIARIDHVAVPTGVPVRQPIGRRLVERVVGGESALEVVELEPGALHEVRLPTPPPAPKPAEAQPASNGLSPAWFGISLGVTAALGGGTVASGVDTLNRHADFRESQTDQARSDGQRAQLRTNILIGVTAASAVVTTALAVFTEWGSSGSSTGAGDMSTLLRF